MALLTDTRTRAAAMAFAVGVGACSTTPTFVQDSAGAGGHPSTSASSGGHGGHLAGASSSTGASTTASGTSATATSSTSVASASSSSAASASSTSATSASSSTGCMPTTCGAGQCGEVSDGCNGMHQCGSCGGGDVCYQGQCCTPKSCGDQGASCGFPPDGCGNQLACSVCPEGQGCGSGGTPYTCTPVSTTSCTGSCPAGTYVLASVTNTDCGGSTCADPTPELVCGVTGVTLMSGCDLSTACPSGWQLVAPYLTCSCPNDGNYFVCVPP